MADEPFDLKEVVAVKAHSFPFRTILKALGYIYSASCWRWIDHPIVISE
jgi:hypothetical protein